MLAPTVILNGNEAVIAGTVCHLNKTNCCRGSRRNPMKNESRLRRHEVCGGCRLSASSSQKLLGACRRLRAFSRLGWAGGFVREEM